MNTSGIGVCCVYRNVNVYTHMYMCIYTDEIYEKMDICVCTLCIFPCIPV